MRTVSISVYSGDDGWIDITKYCIDDQLSIDLELSSDVIGNGRGAFIDMHIIDNDITAGYIPYDVSTKIKVTIDGNDFTGYTNPTYKNITYKSNNVKIREIITLTNYDAMANVNGHLGVGKVNVHLPGQKVYFEQLAARAHSFNSAWEEHTLQKTDINGDYYVSLDNGAGVKLGYSNIKVYNQNGEFIDVDYQWDFDKIRFFTQGGAIVSPATYEALSTYFNDVASHFGYTVDSDLPLYKPTDEVSFSIIPTKNSDGSVFVKGIKDAVLWINSSDGANIYRIFYLNDDGALCENHVSGLQSTHYVLYTSSSDKTGWQNIYNYDGDIIMTKYPTDNSVKIRVYTEVLHDSFTDYTYTLPSGWKFIHHDGATYNDFIGDNAKTRNGYILMGAVAVTSTTVTVEAVQFDIGGGTFSLLSAYTPQIIAVSDGYTSLDYATVMSLLGGVSYGQDENEIITLWYDPNKGAEGIFRVVCAGNDNKTTTILDDPAAGETLIPYSATDMPNWCMYGVRYKNRMYFSGGYIDMSDKSVHQYQWGQIYFPKFDDVHATWVFLLDLEESGVGYMNIDEYYLQSINLETADTWKQYSHIINGYEIEGNYVATNGYGDKYVIPTSQGEANNIGTLIGMRFNSPAITDTAYYTYFLSENAYMTYSFIDDIDTSALDMMNRLGAAFGFVWYISGEQIVIRGNTSSLGALDMTNVISKQEKRKKIAKYDSVKIGRYTTSPIYGKILSFGDDLHHYGLMKQQAEYIKSLLDGKNAVTFETIDIYTATPGETWDGLYIISVKITKTGTQVEAIIE